MRHLQLLEALKIFEQSYTVNNEKFLQKNRTQRKNHQVIESIKNQCFCVFSCYDKTFQMFTHKF